MILTEEIYTEGVLRTESVRNPLNLNAEVLGISARMLHGIIGIATEAGELCEAVVESRRKGKPLDLVNLAEECGDIFWYAAVLRDVLTKMDEPPLGRIPLHSPRLGEDISIEDLIMEISAFASVPLDRTKKTLFYFRHFDTSLLGGEIYDICDRVVELVDRLPVDKGDQPTKVQRIWEVNLAKLKVRYAEGFSLTEAEVRDLKTERLTLETVN